MIDFKLFNILSDLLFREHKRCFICGRKADYRPREIGYICCGCFLELETNFYENCSKCGKKLSSYKTQLVKCGDCNSAEYHFEKASSPLRYEGKVKKIITDFKYEDKAYYKKFLGEFMSHIAIEQGYDELDMIIPVPMEEKKKTIRGYNQAELLAEYIAEKLEITINTDILTRREGFGSQKELNKLQREVNLRKAFGVNSDYVKDKVKEKNILLIDDVYTTGSTVENCSKALKKQGAKAVYVLTAASTPCE